MKSINSSFFADEEDPAFDWRALFRAVRGWSGAGLVLAGMWAAWWAIGSGR